MRTNLRVEKRSSVIMKLINLLIRELKNCSLGDNFRVSHHAEVCQFDHFSSEIIAKEHVVVTMEFPDLVCH